MATVTQSSGRAYTLGRVLFLILVGVTPLVLGMLPQQFGAIAAYHSIDFTILPKSVAVLVLAGASLSALCVSAIRGEVKVYWHPVLWVLVGLVGWAAVSTAFSASPGFSMLGSFSTNEGLAAIFGYALVAFYNR